MIFYLSSRSRFPFRAPFVFFDKIIHFFEFAVLGALILWGFSFATRTPSRLRAGAAVLLAAAGGVADEIHQIFVPGRSASVWDVMADVLGAAAGAAVCFWLLRLKARRLEPR
jgi:VanZ family protein